MTTPCSYFTCELEHVGGKTNSLATKGLSITQQLLLKAKLNKLKGLISIYIYIYIYLYVERERVRSEMHCSLEQDYHHLTLH